MSTAVTDRKISGANCETRESIKVMRKGFYFLSQGQPLLGWLHCWDRSVSSRHGILLCSPWGYEQVHSHRSWRRLADALAEAGFAVLRFDYHGTGDSAGTDEDPDRAHTWLTNVRDARAWLKNHLGCERVSVMGLRLGASLAMQLAAGEEIEDLVLWAPVVNGRAYVRELKAIGLTAAPRPGVGAEATGDMEAAGFVLRKQTADALSQIDLLKIQPRCRRALILTRDDLPQDFRLREHLRKQGIPVEQMAHSGYAAMMAEPHRAEIPHGAIDEAVNWLRSADARVLPSQRPISGALRAAAGGATLRWAGEEITERVLSLGENASLVGILTEPTGGAASDRPIVLLVNAGAAYRIGPNRLYVLLARGLACQGFRSVRLDLGGLGDSTSASADGENDPYRATAFRDIETTLNYLQTALDTRRVVLMGLCSGAYFAFQAAVQVANPGLVESVLINPLTFFWKDGMSLDASPAKEHEEFHYYWNAALKPRNWLKFLCGKTKIGFGGALASLWRRWAPRRPTEEKIEPIAGERQTGGPSHPLRDDLSADLEQVASRDRPVACFFSTSDPGFSILNFHAKRKTRELVRAGKMCVSFIDGADHTFSLRASRLALVQAVCNYLGQRYPRSV